MPVIRSGVTLNLNKVKELEASLLALANRRVLVGVPKETDARPGEPVNNASLAYVHNNGAPEQNIPARPFLIPGVQAALPAITDGLVAAAKAALESDGTEKLDKKLAGVGMVAVASIRQVLRSNIPPPLAEATVRARIERRKSKSWKAKRHAQVDANIAAGNTPQAGLFIALIDTGAMLQSITWVIRKKNSDTTILSGKSGK